MNTPNLFKRVDLLRAFSRRKNEEGIEKNKNKVGASIRLPSFSK
mgnify:CR=1 FL=1